MAMSFPSKNAAGNSHHAGGGRPSRTAFADGLVMKITIVIVFLFIGLMTCGLL
jgi:hypothetical protein